MRHLIYILTFLASLLAVPGAELFFDFSQTPDGQLPAGFESVTGGEGKPGDWRMVEDSVPSALLPALRTDEKAPRKRVLAQVSRDPTDEHFPMLVYTNMSFGDFTFTTRFKCVAGAVEQMAGVVFRYVDKENYYYVRASAKGSTFRFYKVVAGQRSAPIGPEIPIQAGVWHELSVMAAGNKLDFLLNGEKVIPTATDTSFSSGKVGFWTKSDAVSYFTDARITYTPRETLPQLLIRQMLEKYPRVAGMRIYGKAPGKEGIEVLASTVASETGTPGGAAEQGVIEKDAPYFGRLKGRRAVVVTLPLHDRNGEVVAALRVEMESFAGQTESNAVARALPIAREMEMRIVEAKNLF